MAETPVKDSILQSTKKILDAPTGYEVFDLEIITHINAVFSTLAQMGVGPKDSFRIEDGSAVWSDFDVTTNVLNMVRTYIPMKVRLMFDLPPTSFAIEAIQKICSELEWRLNVESDV